MSEEKLSIDDLLTGRQMQIVKCAVAGIQNRETGQLLGISVRTVEVHRYHASQRLGTRNTAGLVRVWLESGRKIPDANRIRAAEARRKASAPEPGQG